MSTTNSWCVYMLYCADGTYYTGITNNIDKRLEAHNRGAGAKYTRGRTPVSLVYKKQCQNRSTASKKEHELKNLSHKEKKELVKRDQ